VSERRETLENRARTSARRALAALDVLEPVASVANPQLAWTAAQDAVAVLDEAQVRDAAAVLAVMAVWELPSSTGMPRSAEQVRDRAELIRRWIRRRRLEAWWSAS
jgi:hypothetical protein